MQLVSSRKVESLVPHSLSISFFLVDAISKV